MIQRLLLAVGLLACGAPAHAAEPLATAPAGARRAGDLGAAPGAEVQGSGWSEIAHMPAPDHDILGAELAGKFYVAGGCAELQNPKRWRAFDEIWELAPNPWRWRVAAKLARERIYCATAAFEGKIWVIGGDVVEKDGSRRSVKTVELYDPKTGALTVGPESLVARPMPLALTAAGRLYLMGTAPHEANLPGPLESIGPGEARWRREPDGPVGMAALAGAALDGKLYLDLPKPGFAIYNTTTQTWETLTPPAPTRSCQMAAYRGEIWMMGGRNGQGGRQTWIFSPVTRTWRLGPPLPEELAWGAAGVVQNKLIVTGGARMEPGAHTIFHFSDATFVLEQRMTK